MLFIFTLIRLSLSIRVGNRRYRLHLHLNVTKSNLSHPSLISLSINVYDLYPSKWIGLSGACYIELYYGVRHLFVFLKFKVDMDILRLKEKYILRGCFQ